MQALTSKIREGKENLPPLEKEGLKKSLSKDSRDRLSKSNLKDRNSSIASKDYSRRDSSMIIDRRHEPSDPSLPSRPESAAEDGSKMFNRLGSRHRTKKLDFSDHGGDGYSTHYSRDRSSVITPESTKYGSFATRPGTGAISKNSQVFTENSEHL